MSVEERHRNNWFQSEELNFVKTAVRSEIHDAIDNSLKALISNPNFTPEQYADLITTTLTEIVKDPETKPNMISWMREAQKSRTKK